MFITRLSVFRLSTPPPALDTGRKVPPAVEIFPSFDLTTGEGSFSEFRPVFFLQFFRINLEAHFPLWLILWPNLNPFCVQWCMAENPMSV